MKTPLLLFVISLIFFTQNSSGQIRPKVKKKDKLVQINPIPKTCKNNLIKNPNFTKGINGIISQTSLSGWKPAYKNPRYSNNQGHYDSGFLSMWGNATVGQATYQQLPVTLESGKTYKISFSMRANQVKQRPDKAIVKLRAATKIPKSPVVCPNGDCEVIGKSRLVQVSEGWVRIDLKDWTPKKNYPYLIVNVENNSSANNGEKTSAAWIDNICIEEITNNGNPELDLDIPVDTICSITNLDFEIEDDFGKNKPEIVIVEVNSSNSPIIATQVEKQLNKGSNKINVKALYQQANKQLNCNRWFKISLKTPIVKPNAPNQVIKKIKYQTHSKYIYVACCDFLPDDPSICTNNMLRDAGFVNGANQNSLPLGNWSVAYGKPSILNSSVGFGDPVSIKLGGNQSFGSAVGYKFSNNNKIKQSKIYKLSLAVNKLDNIKPSAKYFKIKAYAFNGSINGNNAPSLNSNVALIGQTGKLYASDWHIINFPTWTANKNFDNLAIAVYNDENKIISYCEIDNICFHETPDRDPCDNVDLDANGNFIMPSDLANFQNKNYPAQTETVEIVTGDVHDLYGYLGDTNKEDWYKLLKDTCHTVGGFIPPDIDGWNGSSELSDLGINMTLDQFIDVLDNTTIPSVTPSAKKLDPIGSFEPCPKEFNKQPGETFEGRDIIFVHGLKTFEHIMEKAKGVAGAQKEWPTDLSAFKKNGYYYDIAEVGWKEHIEEFITCSSCSNNRYIIVSYNCSQRLDVAIHTMLSQIKAAMTTGEGVIFPEGGNSDCFGKDAVLVSHSTGGILTDVAMATAAKTKTDPVLKSQYGDVSVISDNMRAHIALTGAFSGSDLAEIAIKAAGINPPPELDLVLNFFLKKYAGNFSLSAFKNIAPNSIFMDLVPQVTKNLWGNTINTMPVPTLLATGGHPSALMGIKHIIHDGFDDGVLTMDCQCGHINKASFIYKSKIKTFDMGIAFARAGLLYVDQVRQISGSNSRITCHTYRSPTGMLQSVKSNNNPPVRYNNHFPFIMCPSDHFTGPRGVGMNGALVNGVGFTHPYSYARTVNKDNGEEMKLAWDPILYKKINGSQLVDNDYKTQEEEIKRKKSITLSIRYPKGISIKIKVVQWFPPKVKMVFKINWGYLTKEFIIWKRTYHVLKNSGNQTELHYVYKYILAN